MGSYNDVLLPETTIHRPTFLFPSCSIHVSIFPFIFFSSCPPPPVGAHRRPNNRRVNLNSYPWHKYSSCRRRRRGRRERRYIQAALFSRAALSVFHELPILYLKRCLIQLPISSSQLTILFAMKML